MQTSQAKQEKAEKAGMTFDQIAHRTIEGLQRKIKFQQTEKLLELYNDRKSGK